MGPSRRSIAVCRFGAQKAIALDIACGFSTGSAPGFSGDFCRNPASGKLRVNSGKQLEAFVKELNKTALQGWIVIGLLVLIMLGIVGIGAEIEALPWLWRTYNP